MKLTTTIERFKITDTAIAIPTRFSRKGLSEVVNHLLGLGASCQQDGPLRASIDVLSCTDPEVPFDFLINGTFLRGSLRKYMRKNGLSGVRFIATRCRYALVVTSGAPCRNLSWR